MINNTNIGKDLIQALRKRTSIGLLKCKQALIESNGNIELAIDNLRKSGLKLDYNKSNRSTPSGVIAIEIAPNQKRGLIIEINCETDFVSKNNIFIEFTKKVIATALNESINDIDSLRVRCEKQRLMLINQIDENIQINRFMVLRGNFVGAYVHRSKIGVIVSVSRCIDTSIVKHIAMHIAAKNPRYINIHEIPDNVINRERSVQTEIAKKTLKPTKIVEQIVAGRIERFINDIVLMKQKFILDTDKNIENMLDTYCIKIENFIRFEVGEQI